MKRIQLTLFVGLAATLTSCATKELYSTNKVSLDQAVTQYEAGQFGSSANLSSNLVGDTAGEAGKYQLQRFFAAFLMVQAHMHAAFGGEGVFLEASGSSGGSLLDDAGGKDKFSIPHAVVAGRMTGYGIDWAPSGEAADTQRQQQLPSSLAELGVKSARVNMELCRLAVLTRLGFTLQANGIVEAASSLQKLDSCEKLMDGAKLPGPVRPWITWAAFIYLRKDYEAEAYRFAARTLFPKSGGGVGRQLERELRDWITDGSSFHFECTTCDGAANPTEEFCANSKCVDPRPLIEFVGKARS